MPARKRYRVFLRLLAVSMARNETERNVCQSTCRYRRQFRNHGACSPASESPVIQVSAILIRTRAQNTPTTENCINLFIRVKFFLLSPSAARLYRR